MNRIDETRGKIHVPERLAKEQMNYGGGEFNWKYCLEHGPYMGDGLCPMCRKESKSIYGGGGLLDVGELSKNI